MSMTAALAAVLVPTSGALSRSFEFVPYGGTYAGTRPAISCDGLVPHEGRGRFLQLTHWTNNATPDDLYADTSTECALRLAAARARGAYAAFDDAAVVNNHFDADGALGIWACLEPERALARAPLLAAAAAAGDFREWRSDGGVKVAAALDAIGAARGDDDAAAYLRRSLFFSSPSLISTLFGLSLAPGLISSRDLEK